MAATITYASSRVTISGPYKSFTGSSTSTVVTFSAGEAPAAGDVGRFIWWLNGGTGATAGWQVRRITAATATTCTVHDPWIGTPTAGDTFRLTSNADDILAAQPTAGTKTGSATFAFAGDLALTGGAMFGSADENIEWARGSSSVMFPLETGTGIVCGQLWNGEGVGRQTTNGSRWSIAVTSGTALSSVYTSNNSRVVNGAVVNFFGSLIENTNSTTQQLFQRMNGPARFIGCLFDGFMGGRFYHEASEWVDCRMSGNANATPAWSIGATFTRDIDNVFFFRNLMAMKSFNDFGGTLRNVTLADNTDVFDRGGGGSGSVFNFIDSTEFPQSDTVGTGGTINQFRSVSLVTTLADGSALDGVVVRVNNKDDTTQGAVQTSNGSGVVDEILALRFQQVHSSATMTAFSPFRLRLRKYGYRWQSINAAIADPIKQSSALGVDGNVAQLSATAAAHTGITITDHGGSPVSWQSKNFGITVVGDLSVNASLTLEDIKHYLHYHLAADAAIGGKSSGLLWHDLVPMAGTESAADTYGGTLIKGVRVVDQVGNSFPGVTRHQSDDLSYYTVPATFTVQSDEADSVITIFTTGTQTILASTTGASLAYAHSGETVDYTVQKAGFIPLRVTGVSLSGSQTVNVSMTQDFNYDAGHGLTYTTDASWSRADNELTVPSFGPSVRGVYSLMIDAFISQASLRNTPFNLSMNGPTTLLLIDGAEGATDASITNMTGGGVRYLSPAGDVTAEFCGVLSSGVVSGSQPEYELGEGSAIADARATGNVNQILKVFGDSTHGSLDVRGHLQFKVQRNGYRQAEADVLAAYGLSSLEPTLYIISLPMQEITGLTLGDPSITGVTVTKHGSPVSWDAGDGAKNYSITIEDSGTNSGENILRWLNYFLSLDTTFQGVDPFYWPEMVLDNGPAYETLRGVYHGTPDVVAGVRVIRTGGSPHPDFTRFQSDDGTYGTPPVVASLSVTNIVAGSRMQIYNVTTATEMVNQIVSGTSYSDTYTNGVGYTAGDNVRVRLTFCSDTTATIDFVSSTTASSNGWSVIADQQTCTVYEDLGVDGTSVTGYSADYADTEVDITVASNFYISELFAWWKFNLTTEQGIRNFFGGITGEDIGNFLVNAGVVNIYLDNTTATDVWALDNRRFRRSDGARPIKFPTSGGGGIDVEWREKVLLAETGVSGLTSEESLQLATVASLNISGGNVLADIRAVNGYAVTGEGTEANPWGP